VVGCDFSNFGYAANLENVLTKGDKMSEASRQPKDKNYNLITVLYQSSENAETLKSYVQDAEQEGDQELVEFFNGVLENNLEANQRAKEMLVPRLQQEQE
jgi:hypothetical protein